VHFLADYFAEALEVCASFCNFFVLFDLACEDGLATDQMGQQIWTGQTFGTVHSSDRSRVMATVRSRLQKVDLHFIIDIAKVMPTFRAQIRAMHA